MPSRRWKIAIEAWPHATGKGAEADQAAAGERTNYFYVDAEEIAEAVTMARCFAEGMMRNPMVWQAPIVGVHVIPRNEAVKQDA